MARAESEHLARPRKLEKTILRCRSRDTKLFHEMPLSGRVGRHRAARSTYFHTARRNWAFAGLPSCKNASTVESRQRGDLPRCRSARGIAPAARRRMNARGERSSIAAKLAALSQRSACSASSIGSRRSRRLVGGTRMLGPSINFELPSDTQAPPIQPARRSCVAR